MKKVYTFITLVIICCVTSFAQTTDWEYHSAWHDTTNEDKAYAITATKDGGYVFAGKYGTNGSGAGDIYIAKLSSSGALLWSKTYGDSLGDEARSIKELPDGSFIISGFSLYLGGASGTSYKNVIMKLDSTGDSLWTKSYGSAGIFVPEGLGTGVESTYDGGFIMVGKYANGSNGNDFLVLKTDANGDSLWAKLYGGTGPDIPRSVQRTNDSCYIVSGTTKSFGPNAGTGNMWILKLNQSGDTLWTKVIGSTLEEECYMARPTDDGGYILAGRTGNISVYGSELYVVKTDSAGNKEWEQSFGNPGDNDFGRDIIQTADKGYVIAGARIGTHGYYLIYPPLLYVAKLDNNGAFQWDKEMGYDNSPNGATAYSLASAPDGGFIVSGFDQPGGSPTPGAEDLRAYVVKFTAPSAAGIVPVHGLKQCVVYPNPFNESARLEIPVDVKGKKAFTIYNPEGRIVYSKHINESETYITIYSGNLEEGIYFYELSASSSCNYRGKMILSR
jgi:hypothetical protein